MLKILSNESFEDCRGVRRRDFLKIGGLGLGGLALPGLLQARAHASGTAKDTSVVWLWLGGGATHIETFDPKMDAPSEYRSVTGELRTSVPGVTIGGTFPKIARVMDKMAIVRSFSHKNSGHGGGTHWVMTGHDNRVVDNGGAASHPSIGAILSRVRGANHPRTGMPAYVRQGRIESDGAAFLGNAFSPFDPAGGARDNLTLRISRERFEDRCHLLEDLDTLNRQVDQSGQIQGMDKFEQQAMTTVLGSVSKAFDVKNEDPRTVEKYGPRLGQQLLTARRLCEAGCGFVTVSYGGWDMHGDIKKGLESRSPELDHAVSTFVQDTCERGLDKKILLVITGEFGRTPKINTGAGRDHWAPLSTLALAGGGLRMGQVVGESAAKGDVPKSAPVSPEDLMATIFHVLGIDPEIQFVDTFGRPKYMIEGGRVIRELV
ncbi:MAG TPA: DUF1501 domain-containing protein [Planctomycetota bacterium]|nr:DUF1501 domain-containing protein [Planctomycetota bacterium]